MSKVLIVLIVVLNFVNANDNNLTRESQFPPLFMPDNNLSFEKIEGFENYQVVATHFRKDKNELRYILANSIGYNALRKKIKPMPEGSIIVKIGWSVKEMSTFSTALEADEIQRVEYMIKDSKRFDHKGDNWGYARFVKKESEYVAWDKGTMSCISCHQAVKEDDYLFTRFQERF
ncbi:MAG TPA: cytochrome p460 [Campylobacterales bacterium]|nr:cytochrome p460 [Campylobacterales bacterium]